MIPNIAPALIIGGLMGYGKIPLNMLAMAIMPMPLGIAALVFIDRECYMCFSEKRRRPIPFLQHDYEYLKNLFLPLPLWQQYFYNGFHPVPPVLQ
jgi:hypothetical protein